MINQQKTTPIVYVDISLLDVIDQPMPEQSQGKKERYEKSIKVENPLQESTRFRWKKAPQSGACQHPHSGGRQQVFVK